MTEETYIKERVLKQKEYYSENSTKSKKWFYTLKTIEIVSALSIPFLVSTDCDILASLAGLNVAILAGILGLYKFQEKWTNYRTTAETLKHHLYLYQTESSTYKNEEDRFEKFVYNIEHVISKENSDWQNYITKFDDNKKTKED